MAAGPVPDDVKRVTEDLRVFHWPLAFPEVFSGERPGFDVVVGNPPWEEVTVEELAFYARYSPRLRGLSAGPRDRGTCRAPGGSPELAEELHREQDRVALLKRFLGPAGGYIATPGSDPDLYKYLLHALPRAAPPRRTAWRSLPRSAFLADGSRGSASSCSIPALSSGSTFCSIRADGRSMPSRVTPLRLLVAAATQPTTDHSSRGRWDR